MNLALLLLLALMWSVALLPSVMRNRRRSLHHSMGGFSRSMHVLGANTTVGRDSRVVLVPSDSRRIVQPRTLAEMARERRRRVLKALVTGLAVSVTLGVTLGGFFVLLSTITGIALVGYVTALRSLAVERDRARRLVSIDDHRHIATRDHQADTARHAVGI